MKIKYSFLTLAVLALSMLVIHPSFGQTNTDAPTTLTIPGTKTIGELLQSLPEADRSNYISMLERSANAAKSVNTSNLSAQAKSVLAEAATGAKQAVATNINQVMVEMLSGVKNASGEMYHFSKQEIGGAYDYLKAQAPQVVTEFLYWQVAKAIVWICIWVAVACLLIYIGRIFKGVAAKAPSYMQDDYSGFKWAFRLIACVMLIVTLGINGMVIAKIKVAPRVYIIEYVMDVYNGHGEDYK